MSLFDRHLNPLTPAFLVVLVLAGIAVPTGPALAQDNLVILTHVGTNPIRITNQGRGTSICRPQTVSGACPSTLTWRWTNGGGASNKLKRIVFDFITGTPHADRCLLSGGVATTRFQIVGGTANASVMATVSPLCPPKSAWIYQISCEIIASGDPCPDVDPIDPGAIID